ncbi:PREDICTED: uncharacterized protein LOC106148928 [Chinchilla lanigera]|uniref:uncharacterized protein LOC106148928 n=1 Tax=Chinchilla lanigera TaxID=34839 RepID=UPI0006985CEE|nr:PREDICTED: uncharacterized protein LOC106148928 [Chinchilla lanigera]
MTAASHDLGPSKRIKPMNIRSPALPARVRDPWADTRSPLTPGCRLCAGPQGHGAGSCACVACPCQTAWLPPSLESGRYCSAPLLLSSGVRALPTPPGCPQDGHTLGVRLFTNVGKKGAKRCPYLAPGASLSKASPTTSSSQGWAGPAGELKEEKEGEEGRDARPRSLAAEAAEARRRASLSSCRGSSSPKFPGSLPWSAYPSQHPARIPAAKVQPDVRNPAQRPHRAAPSRAGGHTGMTHLRPPGSVPHPVDRLPRPLLVHLWRCICRLIGC